MTPNVEYEMFALPSLDSDWRANDVRWVAPSGDSTTLPVSTTTAGDSTGFSSGARIQTVGRTEIVSLTVDWRLPGGNTGTVSVPFIIKAGPTSKRSCVKILTRCRYRWRRSSMAHLVPAPTHFNTRLACDSRTCVRPTSPNLSTGWGCSMTSAIDRVAGFCSGRPTKVRSEILLISTIEDPTLTSTVLSQNQRQVSPMTVHNVHEAWAWR